MKLIFQNEFFVAVEKESGWLTTPGRFGEQDPRPVLGLRLQEEMGRQIFPVHRLDFEVSGLVLFALTAEAHAQANRLFEGKQVRKIYQAQTENKAAISPQEGAAFEWKARLLRGKKRAYESPHGKPSLTLARVLKSSLDSVHWELKPITGRSHQLRFDLARHGFPIWGDTLYGASERADCKDRIALRSISLQFLDVEFTRRWQLSEQLVVSALFETHQDR